MNNLELYRWVLTSRILEFTLGEKNPRWFSTQGEEGTIVGTFAALQDGDIAAPHYRGPFVTYLMRGADLKRLVSQAFGKVAGYNKGRSVPFTGPGDLGFVPWVAGDLGSSLGVATGAALSLKQANQGNVCICSFGDGTSNRGDFHESVNMASLWNLPIVYVCQNNGWAISQSAKTYLPAPIVDRAKGYGIPGVVVDGNDAIAVQQAVVQARTRAGAGEGPTLIEARMWRKGGHWAADNASYRTEHDIPESPADPLLVLQDRLLASGELSQDYIDDLRKSIESEVADAIAYATALPNPQASDLGLDEVYA